MNIVRINSMVSVLLLVNAALFGPGGTGALRCAAQQGVQIDDNFPYAPGGGAVEVPGAYKADETTYSIGVCQLVVDPANAGLFAAVSATILSYPGYSPTSYTLTSPVLYDGTTVIGSSVLEGFLSGSGGGADTVSQIIPNQYTIGSGVIVGGPDLSAPWNEIGPGAYLAIPPTFAGGFPGPAPGALLVNTEIEMFDLVCYELSCVTNDSRTPPPPPSPIDMVTAGPNSGMSPMYPAGLFGGGWNPATQLQRRSLGMVQQDSTVSGTTAESFFDINVQVNLPAVASTASAADFPPIAGYPYTPDGLLRLTNNWMTSPLLITNTNVATLPPFVTYIHGSTPAVDLYFMDDGPTWSAGDHFGFITLAGHGVVTNSDTNGCSPGSSTGQDGGEGSFTAAQVTTMLDNSLGKVGTPAASMPPLWPQVNPTFPTAGTTLNSKVNTTVIDGVTNNNDGSVGFYEDELLVLDFIVGPLPSSGSLPVLHGTTTYTAANFPISFQLSYFGDTYDAVGTGSMAMLISNGGFESPITYANPPQITDYNLLITSFTGSATWAGGTIYVQQDPTNSSTGLHIVETTPGGWKVGDSLNFNFDVSSDDEDFLTGTGPLQMLTSAPPAPRPTLHATVQGSNLVFNWQGGGTFQTTTILQPNGVGWTSLTSSNTLSPYSIPLINLAKKPAQYFRLKQP